jgi:hypothetical protein
VCPRGVESGSSSREMAEQEPLISRVLGPHVLYEIQRVQSLPLLDVWFAFHALVQSFGTFVNGR